MLLHLDRSFYICPAKFLLDYELLLEFTISCRGVLCCVVSCRVVLCFVALCCAVLFCVGGYGVCYGKSFKLR